MGGTIDSFFGFNTCRSAGALVALLYTLRSPGTQVSAVLALYRHIAPLERKAVHISFNKKLMDSQ